MLFCFAQEPPSQAIEFWCTVCDEEQELIDEHQQAREEQREPEEPFYKFAEQSLNSLVPLLLESMTKQSEEVDDDTWNVAMAAGVCLSLLAQTCENEIVPRVVPWVQRNINSQEWRLREAATLAFACILDGPDKDVLTPLVASAFPLILSHMKDPNALVKDTTAWCIGRICSLLPENIDEAVMPKLMDALGNSLGDEPKVAGNVCWAIHNLAEAVKPAVMVPYFRPLVLELLKTTERPDVTENNLLVSSYEAIGQLIQTADDQLYELIGQLMPALMERLRQTIQAQSMSAEDRERVTEVQGLLCGALTTVIHKISGVTIEARADDLMTLFLQVLQSKKTTVQEEVLLSIGAIANRVEGKFKNYMGHFQPHLEAGLRNTEDHHLCTVAVGVVGDVARALEGDLKPFCDNLIALLLSNLHNSTIQRSVKPHIISCLGDIALAVGGFFQRYMGHVMGLLQGASQTQFQHKDYDDEEYLENLRNSVLEAYVGILQGLAGENQQDHFLQSVQGVAGFFDLLHAERLEDCEDSVICNATNLIGDMFKELGPKVVQVGLVSSVFTSTYLNE